MSERRRPPARLAALVAVVSTAALLASPDIGAAGSRYSQTVRTIAPGVKFTKIVDSQGPKRIFLLTISPGYASSVDVAMAGSSFPMYARTSTMVQRYGAVAGVNGDFVEGGRPIHPFMEDGELVTAGMHKGTSFAIRADETAAWVNEAAPSVTATKLSNGQSFKVNLWNNGDPRRDEIAGYTPVGGSTENPPKDGCYVRLFPSGQERWATNKTAVERDYRVDKVVCQYSPLSLSGGVVLVADRGTSTANTLTSISAGQTLRLATTIGWSGVLDTIGGQPLLLRDGNVVAPASCGSYFCNRNPRTAVGITADGKVLIMVVDGRRSGWSVGMDLVELAQELKRNGAVRAVNLDGGGAATMVVNGSIVNKPSDGSERSVSTALIVLPGADSGEANGLAAAPLFRSGGVGSFAPADPAAAAEAIRLAESDPASTGGLLASGSR